jgi:hypothetical protein
MAESKRIIYRGVPMIQGWPEKIKAAQHVLTYMLDGNRFRASATVTSKMIGKPTQYPAMIAELLKVSFTFRPAMSKSVPSVTASCFHANARLMILKMNEESPHSEKQSRIVSPPRKRAH